MSSQKRAIFTLIVTLGFVCITNLAQTVETFVTLKDLPEAARSTVQKQSEGAKLRGLIKRVESDQTFYRAEVQVKGHKRYILVDETGSIAEIAEETPFATLPVEVKATIEQKGGKDKVKGVKSITRNSVVVAYEARISSDEMIREIKVGADGKLISLVNTNIVVR